METDYSKHTHFQWKIKWHLEHLGALGIMGQTLLTKIENVLLKGTSTRLVSTTRTLLPKTNKEIQNDFLTHTTLVPEVFAPKARTSGEAKFAPSAPPRARKPLGPGYTHTWLP